MQVTNQSTVYLEFQRKIVHELEKCLFTCSVQIVLENICSFNTTSVTSLIRWILYFLIVVSRLKVTEFRLQTEISDVQQKAKTKSKTFLKTFLIKTNNNIINGQGQPCLLNAIFHLFSS